MLLALEAIATANGRKANIRALGRRRHIMLAVVARHSADSSNGQTVQHDGHGDSEPP